MILISSGFIVCGTLSKYAFSNFFFNIYLVSIAKRVLRMMLKLHFLFIRQNFVTLYYWSSFVYLEFRHISRFVMW